MIEWVVGLSTQEMWLYGLIATASSAIFIALISHFLEVRRKQRQNMVSAAHAFRGAFNVEVFRNASGHYLNAILLGASTSSLITEGEFSKHKRAFKEYRVFLGFIDRHRLDNLWRDYHGGNEEYPDFFIKYCISSDGCETLIKRLQKIRKFGEMR